MADQQDTTASSHEIQPPSVGEHDAGEVHSASAVDQPKPEEIVERLTDVPGDEQAERQTKTEAREDKEQDEPPPPPPTEERRKSSTDRNAELRARIAAETKAYDDARLWAAVEQQGILRARP